MDKAGSYIGRIGGLAVALGVGAAVLSGAGIAGGQTDDGSAGAASEAPSSQSGSDSDAAPKTESEPDDRETEDSEGDSGAFDSAEFDTTELDTAEFDTAEFDEPEPDRGPKNRKQVEPEVPEVPAAPEDGEEPAEPRESAAPEIELDVTEPAVETPDDVPEPVQVSEVVVGQPVKVEAPDTEPTPEPTTVAATLVSTVLTTVLAPLADGPAAPAPPPVPLTLMALARREVEGALMASAPAVESVSTPTVAAAVADPPIFTGRPSLITQVFVAGLRLIKPVLDLFGFELNGTSARIPFFTDGIPPFFVTFGLKVTSSEYEGWKVWTLAPPKPTEKVVVAVHGGAFISTASLFHWWTYADLARQTGATVVVPLYPLANAAGTGGTAKTVVPTMADFIAARVAADGGRGNVSVLGDSAGGSIALAAAQELVRRCGDDQGCLAASLPARMVLLSPALDSSMTNPAIADVDDPLLSPASSKRTGLWWSRGLETPEDPDGTRHPFASPLYGSLAHLPPTAVYAGSLDIRTPDVLVLQQKAEQTPGAAFRFELRKGQIHDWAIFPFLPDAHADRPKIYRDLGLAP